MRTFFRNPLFRLLAINWLAGFVVTVLLVAGFYLTDIGGLWSLIMRSETPFVPIAMLFFGFLITFTSAAMGTAIMSMPSDGSGGGGRRLRIRAPELVPIRVKANANPRRG
ncbi:hypothetical protein [Breoghania corrubedonensis]|uniref:hypothetical protein n=1 Tax=Breoghania corrubedonensis TaxID=665038 RepID=UPI001FEB57AA|nr:hypothetical protein [Breoghania corrubedonensis]